MSVWRESVVCIYSTGRMFAEWRNVEWGMIL